MSPCVEKVKQNAVLKFTILTLPCFLFDALYQAYDGYNTEDNQLGV